MHVHTCTHSAYANNRGGKSIRRCAGERKKSQNDRGVSDAANWTRALSKQSANGMIVFRLLFGISWPRCAHRACMGPGVRFQNSCSLGPKRPFTCMLHRHHEKIVLPTDTVHVLARRPSLLRVVRTTLPVCRAGHDDPGCDKRGRQDRAKR